MAGANDEILRQALLHAYFLQQYKAGVAERVLLFLNQQVLPELTRRIEADLAALGVGNARALSRFRRTSLSEDVLTSLSDGIGQASDLASAELRAFAPLEADWQIDVVRTAIPVKVEMSLPSPQTLRALVETQPVQGTPMAQWFEAIESSTQRAIITQVGVGIAAGESIGEIVNRLTGTARRGYNDGIFQATRRNIDTTVRTTVAEVSTQAREETYKANLKVIKAVMWVSTLDSRTTLLCQHLDHKLFLPGKGPRPPAHFNCRSTTVPVIKSWKELGFDFDELTERTRASLTGQVPERITYGDWLKGQPSDLQDEALGPARGRLFRQGKFSVDQFVDRRGRTLTLEQLGRTGRR